VGFALLGAACLAYGQSRSRHGEQSEANHAVTLALTLGGLVLGVGLVVVLAIEP
jgi:hypothetical protein